MLRLRSLSAHLLSGLFIPCLVCICMSSLLRSLPYVLWRITTMISTYVLSFFLFSTACSLEHHHYGLYRCSLILISSACSLYIHALSSYCLWVHKTMPTLFHACYVLSSEGGWVDFRVFICTLLMFGGFVNWLCQYYCAPWCNLTLPPLLSMHAPYTKLIIVPFLVVTVGLITAITSPTTTFKCQG